MSVKVPIQTNESLEKDKTREKKSLPTRPVPLHRMPNDEAIDVIDGWFERAKADKAEINERCERYLNIYKALDVDNIPTDEETGDVELDERLHSNTFLPLGSAIIDSAVAEVYQNFFSNPDYMEVVSDDPMDMMAQFRITEHMKRRHKEMRFKKHVYEALLTAACFDFAVTGMTWKIKGGYVPKRRQDVSDFSMGGIKAKYQSVGVDHVWMPNAVDRPHFETFDFFNSFPDYNSRDGFEGSEFFIDVYYPLIDELFAMEKTEDKPWGKYTNLLEAFGAELGDQKPADQSDENERMVRSYEQNKGRAKVVRVWTHHEVIEYWNRIIISRRKVPGMPLQLWTIYPLMKQFGGMGICQRLERPQLDINHVINLKRDAQNLMISPWLFINEDLLPAGHQGDVHTYAGKTFIDRGGGNVNDKFKVVQPGVDQSSAYTEEIGLQMMAMERVAHRGPNQVGSFSQGRKTARESSEVAAGSQLSASLVSIRMEENALSDALQCQFLLEQTYMTKEDIFRYEGPQGVNFLLVRPSDYAFRRMPQFEAKGTSHIIDKQMHEMQFFKGLAVAQQFSQLHNWPELLKHMWMMLDAKNANRFLKSAGQNDENIAPDKENYMLAHGHKVDVSPANDDKMHLAAHRKIQQSDDFLIWPDRLKQNFMSHIAAHEQQMANKQQGAGFAPRQQDESDMMRGQRQ